MRSNFCASATWPCWVMIKGQQEHGIDVARLAPHHLRIAQRRVGQCALTVQQQGLLHQWCRGGLRHALTPLSTGEREPARAPYTGFSRKVCGGSCPPGRRDRALPEHREEREAHGEAAIPRRPIGAISGILPGRPACRRSAPRRRIWPRGGPSHRRRAAAAAAAAVAGVAAGSRRGGGSVRRGFGHGLRLKRLASTQSGDRLGVDRDETCSGAPVGRHAIGAVQNALRGSIGLAAFPMLGC